MSTSTLSATGLAKAYKGRKVVKNVSMKVSAGQIVGLLGPNGAGKTTSFYMIVGLVNNDSGSIVLNGEDLTLLPMHERASAIYHKKLQFFASCLFMTTLWPFYKHVKP